MKFGSEALVGQEVGGYRVEGVLGTGGTAVVYRATRVEAPPLALKMLFSEAARDPGAQARFQREIEQAQDLGHPNLVRVHGAGVHDGAPFYVMDLVEGETLDAYLEEVGTPPFEEAVHILKGACRGLAYLHQQKMVHRDLKPANIFLSGPRRDVLLGDFGLLKSLEVDDLTASNERIGTPAYMSPEQYKGVRIDERSDIYQAGVLLFRLLTGQVPFEDENFFRLGMKHMTRRPPAPRSLDAEIPEELEAVILRCLEKRPRARYPHAGELIRDLNRFLVRRELGTDVISLDEFGSEPLELSGGDLGAEEPGSGVAPVPRLSGRLRPPPESRILPPMGDLLGKDRSQGTWELTWAVVSVSAAALALGIGIFPEGTLLGWSRLAVASGLAGLLLFRAVVYLGARVSLLGAWAGTVALGYLLPLVPALLRSGSPGALVTAELAALRSSPWAAWIPGQAPFSFGRAVLLPALSLGFLYHSWRELGEEDGGPRAIRGLTDFALAVALLFALSRCCLAIGSHGSKLWR